MRLFKKFATSFLTLSALAASILPAHAESFYFSPVTAPIISIGNVIYSSSDWNVGATAGTFITEVSYTAKYTVTKYSSSPYTLEVRVCQRLTGSTPCSAWGAANVSNASTLFNGNDAMKPFFFQSRVTGTNVTLNPKPGANGNSILKVGYE